MKQDYKKGMELYELAGKQGDTIALCNLGKLYRDGEGVDKDVNAAKEYFLRAVELGGRYADYLIGDMYERHFLDDDNYKNAVMWYTKSADKGYDVGLLSLGEMYSYGKGVLRDKQKAVDLYRRAAIQNGTASADAYTRIGQIYTVMPYNDYIEAEIWLKKAADKEYSQAQYLLGKIYCDISYMKDEDKAIQYLQLAADQGCEEAQRKLDEITN